MGARARPNPAAVHAYDGPVPTCRETPVSDATAHELLTEYFAYRESAFPVPHGYRTTFPDPAAFTPPRGVFLVIEHAGEAVGCGGIRSLGDGVFEVKHVWVRPEARGRGHSKALMAELEHRARGFGATALVLDTHESLEAANLLYRGLGYVETEPYNDNPNASRWYHKELAPQ